MARILKIIFLFLFLFPRFVVCQPTYVATNEYIIQRRTNSVSKIDDHQIRYLTINPSEHFDTVVPNRHGTSAQSLVESKEILNISKVSADCAEILKDPTVITCEPNIYLKQHIFPNDALFQSQWGLHDPTTFNSDIEAPTAWDKGTGDKNTLVGIVDSGVYYSHPDLIENIWSNPSEPVDGVDNDGNGYVDDSFGVNTYYHDNNPNDCDGHGTHVAGIIAARGNNTHGIAGINWQSNLITVGAEPCGYGGITTDNVIKGYDYFYTLKSLGHNIRVINVSLGGPTYSAASYSALQRLNSIDVLVVASAGNDNANMDSTPNYPASYDLPNIISVGATGPTLDRASYSNYGQTVDITAPGGDISSFGSMGGIVSTYSPIAPGGKYFELLQGTSMAAPMVTGALALIASQRPYLNGTHLKSMLLSSADSISSLLPYVNGGRFLNVGRMSTLADPTDNCPSNPNKLEPGICGCDLPDSYINCDNDQAYDCVDSCPVDPSKTSPGICGCGISDNDANGNGRADCLDPVISNIQPPRLKVKENGKRINLTMTSKSGVEYYIRIKITPPKNIKGKTKTFYYVSLKNTGWIKKPAKGSTLNIVYAFRVIGTASDFSYWSPNLKYVVKK